MTIGNFGGVSARRRGRLANDNQRQPWPTLVASSDVGIAFSPADPAHAATRKRLQQQLAAWQQQHGDKLANQSQ